MSSADELLSTDEPAGQGHNSDTYRVTASELRNFIERYERLEVQKKDVMEVQKEVMAEAKARGYDTKVIRKVLAERKRDADDVAEETRASPLRSCTRRCKLRPSGSARSCRQNS